MSDEEKQRLKHQKNYRETKKLKLILNQYEK